MTGREPAPVRTIRLDLAYDGTGFHGWARQAGLRTVQGALEVALERALREPVQVVAAGRTDAGVHARGQVASFRAAVDDLEALARALNGMLGPEIAVAAREAPEGFHARFSATAREYVYRIRTVAEPDPFGHRYVWHLPEDLSVPAMRAAAASISTRSSRSPEVPGAPIPISVRVVSSRSVNSGSERRVASANSYPQLRQRSTCSKPR